MLKVWRNKEIAKKQNQPKFAIYIRLSREEIAETEEKIDDILGQIKNENNKFYNFRKMMGWQS